MDPLLCEIREYIRLGKVESMKQLVFDLIEAKKEKEYRYNFEYLWQKAYLHACICLRKHPTTQNYVEMVEFLRGLYEMFDDITKIACKPTLIYGKYVQ